MATSLSLNVLLGMAVDSNHVYLRYIAMQRSFNAANLGMEAGFEPAT